ncbi:MAG: hypothetical protein SFX18_05120 [Pirellulales bacterium]|nr:hypothetical protein [Pirellulales bacterium]
MPPTLCERIAAPLLELHRKTTPLFAIILLGAAALSIIGYAWFVGNLHLMWGGVVLAVVSWYGFLLSGCERLLSAKEERIGLLERQLALKADQTNAADSQKIKA